MKMKALLAVLLLAGAVQAEPVVVPGPQTGQPQSPDPAYAAGGRKVDFLYQAFGSPDLLAIARCARETPGRFSYAHRFSGRTSEQTMTLSCGSTRATINMGEVNERLGSAYRIVVVTSSRTYHLWSGNGPQPVIGTLDTDSIRADLASALQRDEHFERARQMAEDAGEHFPCP